MDLFEKLFNMAGSLICHQLPSRTIHADGMALPVCARDTGIYLGIFTTTFYLLLMRRFKSEKPPDIFASLVMVLLMAPMIIDGFLSYTGIIETSNLRRLLTGAFFGLPIPFFLIPAAHFKVEGKNTSMVLKNRFELAAVYGMGLGLCYAVWNGIMPYVVFGLIFISSLLFILGRMSYTIYVRYGRLRKKAVYILTGVTTISVVLFLGFVSEFLLKPIKTMLLGN